MICSRISRYEWEDANYSPDKICLHPTSDIHHECHVKSLSRTARKRTDGRLVKGERQDGPTTTMSLSVILHDRYRCSSARGTTRPKEFSHTERPKACPPYPHEGNGEPKYARAPIRGLAMHHSRWRGRPREFRLRHLSGTSTIGQPAAGSEEARER